MQNREKIIDGETWDWHGGELDFFVVRKGEWRFNKNRKKYLVDNNTKMIKRGVTANGNDVKQIYVNSDYVIFFLSKHTGDKTKRCGFARVYINFDNKLLHPIQVSIVHCVSSDVPAEEAENMFIEFFKSMRSKMD